MSCFRLPALLALMVALIHGGAQSQPAYRSAFDGYKRFGDEPLLPWRQANDTVGRIGGWQAYAREAQGAAAPDPAASAPVPHGGHRPR